MTHIAFVTLETPDAEAAERFYTDVFGLTDHIRVAESHEPTSGFRGFTLSLIVAQPSNADLYLTAAVEAGAEPLKPAKKSYGVTAGSSDPPTESSGRSPRPRRRTPANPPENTTTSYSSSASTTSPTANGSTSNTASKSPKATAANTPSSPHRPKP